MRSVPLALLALVGLLCPVAPGSAQEAGAPPGVEGAGAAQPDGPTTGTAPDAPASPSEPERPASPTQPEGPATDAAPDGPVPETEPDGPATETEPDAPAPVEPDAVVTDPEPDGPPTDAGPDTPASDAEAAAEPDPGPPPSYLEGDEAWAYEEEEERGPPPGPTLAETHPFYVGAAFHAGLFRGDNGMEGYWAPSLEIAATVARGWVVGVADLTGGTADDPDGASVTYARGAPFLELYGFVDARAQLYARAGLTIQGQSTTAASGDALQLRVMFAGGLRWWFADMLTLGAELRFGVTVIDHMALGIGARPAPSPSYPLGLGASLGAHF